MLRGARSKTQGPKYSGAASEPPLAAATQIGGDRGSIRDRDSRKVVLGQMLVTSLLHVSM